MLTFLRKHQKFFFFFTAIAVIASFSFFGTYSAVQDQKKEDKTPLGAAFDGTIMRKQEIAMMSRFLSTDRYDMDSFGRGEPPNFLNDGLIRQDIFLNGLADKIIDVFYQELEQDLTEKVVHFKGYQPFQHPNYPDLSAAQVWSHFMPSLNENLKKFQKEAEDWEAVNHLVHLYIDQSRFPSFFLKQFLFQTQYQKMGYIDPILENADFALFHAHSIEQWFGRTFLDLCSQLVHNISIIAQKKGFTVSLKEAKEDLYRISYESLKSQKKEEPTAEEHWQFVTHQLDLLQIDEETAAKIWQKVLLFRKYLSSTEQSLLFDPMVYKAYDEHASAFVELNLFEIPKHLEISSFDDLLKLHLYLKSIGPMANQYPQMLEFPKVIYPLKQVEENMAALIQKKYRLRLRHARKEEISLNIPLKEIWQWQTDQKNWKLVQHEFSELTGKFPQTSEESTEILDKLPLPIKRNIDRFSRLKMVETQSEWIQKALQEAPFDEKEISFSISSRNLPLEGVEEPKALYDYLEKITGSETAASEDPVTFDGENYYVIEVLERMPDEILTFEKVLQEGALDRTLKKLLEDAYPSIRQKEPLIFKNESNEWRPFEEVSGLVGKYLYSELCLMIEKQYQNLYPDQPLKGHLKQPLEFYVSNRFLRNLYQYQESLKNDAVIVEEAQDPLMNQWRIPSKNLKVFRKEKNAYVDENVFAMKEGIVSPILSTASKRHPYFFQLLKKGISSPEVGAQLQKGKQLLAKEAKRALLDQLLIDLKAKKAIHLKPQQAMEHSE